MDVHIGEVTSTVRAVDGDALLSPKTMNAIIQAVLHAVHEREAHHKRVRTEQRISGGVSAEQEEEG